MEEFRSRLNKLSAKIDQCEGSIMGDLESIEAKRLDQALKTTKEFEDRSTVVVFLQLYSQDR